MFHYALKIRQTFDQQYPRKYTGKGGVVKFPARSPDFTF